MRSFTYYFQFSLLTSAFYYTAATTEKKCAGRKGAFLKKPEFIAYHFLHWNVKMQTFSAVASLSIEDGVPFSCYFVCRFIILPFSKLNYISHLSAHDSSLAKSLEFYCFPIVYLLIHPFHIISTFHHFTAFSSFQVYKVNKINTNITVFHKSTPSVWNCL